MISQGLVERGLQSEENTARMLCRKGHLEAVALQRVRPGFPETRQERVLSHGRRL